MPDEAIGARPPERADANYREFFRAMARISPHGAIHEDRELLLVRTGPLLPFLNAAIVTRPPADPAAAFGRAEAFFAPSDQPWALITSDVTTDAMAPSGIASGRRPHPSPGMLLHPLEGEPPPVPGLTVQAVRETTELRLYIDTMTTGFGGEPWARGEMVQTPALLEAPDLTHYLGFVDGTPAATATRFASHRIAGVFNVSTVPADRGRGVGAALTWRAALDGRVEGCVASSLQASEMGLSVYRRIGYREVMTYQVWLRD